MLAYKMLSVFILLYKHAEEETNGKQIFFSCYGVYVVSLSPLIYNYIPEGFGLLPAACPKQCSVYTY